MLFHEIYGTYFEVTGAVLREAAAGELTRARLLRIISERAFGESVLTIPDALLDGTWPLLGPDLRTPLLHAPSRPMSNLELRWLRTVLDDPRVRLFLPPENEEYKENEEFEEYKAKKGDAARDDPRSPALPEPPCESPAPDTAGLLQSLRGVEPLFDREDLVRFDQDSDGDPFEDPVYIRHFRQILDAVRTKRRLHIRFAGSSREHEGIYTPLCLEYSEKNDKFRMQVSRRKGLQMIGVARILECSLLEDEVSGRPVRSVPPVKKRTVTLELTDRRRALERAMLHFSDLEKETVRVEEDRYRIRLHFPAEDETEILIRVLSFGPMIRVTGPDGFVKKVRDRVGRQAELFRQD